jgi:hypothetical protein
LPCQQSKPLTAARPRSCRRRSPPIQAADRHPSNCSPPFQTPPVQVPAARPDLGCRRRTSLARPLPPPVTISAFDDERPSTDVATAPHLCRRRHQTSKRVHPPLTRADNVALPVARTPPLLTSAVVAVDRPQWVLQTLFCPWQGRCRPATAIQLKVLCART